VTSEMHSEAVIEKEWTCTEAKIRWTQRFTWRLGSSEFGHALGCQDEVNYEMQQKAMTERVWRCTEAEVR
jgi:hypothetical protein